jgi:hypothetical protein
MKEYLLNGSDRAKHSHHKHRMVSLPLKFSLLPPVHPPNLTIGPLDSTVSIVTMWRTWLI